MTTAEFLTRLGAMILADLLLSGDNAVVIALVCRELPPRLRLAGVALGTAGAVLLRVVTSIFAATLIALPGLRLIGGLLLLWVAYGLVREQDESEEEPTAAQSLLRAVWLIALADVSMSLDNVIALAALARGSWTLMIVGVTLSIPIVVAGASVISRIVDRAPALVWVGAALLGWVAGGVAAGDPWLTPHMGAARGAWEWGAAAAGAAGVVLAALCANALRPRDRGAESTA